MHIIHYYSYSFSVKYAFDTPVDCLFYAACHQLPVMIT